MVNPGMLALRLSREGIEIERPQPDTIDQDRALMTQVASKVPARFPEVGRTFHNRTDLAAYQPIASSDRDSRFDATKFCT